MHSDGNGKFYVINLEDLSKSSHDDIEAKVDIPSHGKLQWDESPKLADRGFATSTGELFLFEIDDIEYVFEFLKLEFCEGI